MKVKIEKLESRKYRWSEAFDFLVFDFEVTK